MKQLRKTSTAQTCCPVFLLKELYDPYFSIHAFFAAGLSAALAITVLFLLSGSGLKRATLFPRLLDVTAGSI